MLAARAANSSKTLLQIPALEKGCHGSLDNRAPETVLGLKPFIVNLLERVKMLVNQTPQVGCMWIAWLVQYGQFGKGGNHSVILDGCRTGPDRVKECGRTAPKCTADIDIEAMQFRILTGCAEMPFAQVCGMVITELKKLSERRVVVCEVRLDCGWNELPVLWGRAICRFMPNRHVKFGRNHACHDRRASGRAYS
ncbi:MAG: hypothetical protein ABGX16_20415 [Pirellulales bacterium]